MQWFYAVNGQRFGPVSMEDFARLVAAGTVADDTLVWREGLPNWVTWGSIAAETQLPRVDEAGAGGPPVVPSAEPGGAEAGGEATDWSLEEFSRRLDENGFGFSVEGGFGRIWRTVTNGYWLGLGVVLVATLIMVVAGMVPIVGLAASFIVSPQLTAGMAWFFLRRARGEEPAFDTVFDGYRIRFGGLAGVAAIQLAVGLVVVFLMFLLMLPFGLTMESFDKPETFAPAVGIGFALVMLGVGFVVAIIAARFMLVHVIVMDQTMGIIDAFRLSWRITGKRFWSLLAIALIILLINFVAAMLLILPVVFVLPLIPAALARVYEDARLSAAGTPPENP